MPGLLRQQMISEGYSGKYDDIDVGTIVGEKLVPAIVNFGYANGVGGHWSNVGLAFRVKDNRLRGQEIG
jgi:hypothetical protein